MRKGNKSVIIIIIIIIIIITITISNTGFKTFHGFLFAFSRKYLTLLAFQFTNYFSHAFY